MTTAKFIYDVGEDRFEITVEGELVGGQWVYLGITDIKPIDARNIYPPRYFYSLPDFEGEMIDALYLERRR